MENVACRTLVRLYPISPAMADQWLVTEIARGASDPGALAVFRQAQSASSDVSLLTALYASTAISACCTAAQPGCVKGPLLSGHAMVRRRNVSLGLISGISQNYQGSSTWCRSSVTRRSVFYLPAPKPLNYLVQDMYGGPCMVLQGAKDPLNDARARAAALGAACPNVQVQLINGGHCPVQSLSLCVTVCVCVS